MSALQLAVLLAGIFILLTALVAVGKVVAIAFGIAIVVLAILGGSPIVRR